MQFSIGVLLHAFVFVSESSPMPMMPGHRLQVNIPHLQSIAHLQSPAYLVSINKRLIGLLYKDKLYKIEAQDLEPIPQPIPEPEPQPGHAIVPRSDVLREGAVLYRDAVPAGICRDRVFYHTDDQRRIPLENGDFVVYDERIIAVYDHGRFLSFQQDVPLAV